MDVPPSPPRRRRGRQSASSAASSSAPPRPPASRPSPSRPAAREEVPPSPSPPFPSSVPASLLFLTSSLLFSPVDAATYLPVTYQVSRSSPECLYERVSGRGEHLTASVFVLSGETLAANVVFEGPVAPVDLDLEKEEKSGGMELQKYLHRYEREGMDMFVKGKFGDSMMDVVPLRIAELVDFEGEEEDYFDDYAMTDAEREEFNRRHDAEHRHREMEREPPPPEPERPERRKPAPRERLEEYERRRGLDEKEREEGYEGEEEEGEEGDYFKDDFVRAKEEMRREKLMREAEVDDDFVKLQQGDRRTLHEDGGDRDPRRRRLREEVKLLPGEPYQKTVSVESPGWYRLCVVGSNSPVEAELELRKSSLYGHVDRRTGHVPSFEEVEAKSEIHRLYEKEDDARILEEEQRISDEDLKATREQVRILERIYADIVQRQLEERRQWNWRTIRNQHVHSHLVLGNFVETIVYMAVTGWQVYTIRKWFGGGPALGM
ncbi:hypothetical protein ACHAWF_011500 [Thalassiosira exigua]